MTATDKLETSPCPQCGEVGKLRIEYRDKLVAKPLGSFSLAGAQMKVSARRVQAPFLCCDACGLALEGKKENRDSTE